MRYRDPVTGEWRSESPQYGDLAGLLRMYAYQPQVAAMLPLLLHEAAQGRYESLLAQSRMLTDSVGEAIMHGMQLSVMCSEDAGDMRVDDADADTVLGNELVGFAIAQCAVWPKGARAKDFRAPLAGDVPVLRDQRRIRSGDAAALRRRGGEDAAATAATWCCRARVTACSASAACRSCSRSSSRAATPRRSMPVA